MKKFIMTITIIAALCSFQPVYVAAADYDTNSFVSSIESRPMTVEGNDIYTIEGSLADIIAEQPMSVDVDDERVYSYSEEHPSSNPYNPYNPFYDKELDVIGTSDDGEYLHLYAAHGDAPAGYTGFFITKDYVLCRLYIDWLGNMYIMSDSAETCVTLGDKFVIDLINGETLCLYTEEIDTSVFGVPTFDVFAMRTTQPTETEAETEFVLGEAISLNSLFTHGFNR